MEKRRVSILISGHPCSFYSDDSDEYISALEQRANAIMKETAQFSGSSAYTNAILTVLSMTDKLLRTEQQNLLLRTEQQRSLLRTEQKGKMNAAKAAAAGEDNGQVSMWDLLDDQK